MTTTTTKGVTWQIVCRGGVRVLLGFQVNLVSSENLFFSYTKELCYEIYQTSNSGNCHPKLQNNYTEHEKRYK